jgi:hypothetical protein
VDAATLAIVAAICVVAAIVLEVARRKRLRIEKQGDTLMVEIRDRQPRVEKRGDGAIIHYDGQRIEVLPEWRFAPPKLAVNRWRTGGEAWLSIHADGRLLYKGQKDGGEQVLAELRKYVK